MTRTPQDTFLSDQTLAAAREAALDPGTVPVAITAADGKKRCTWCDCPDGPDSPHNRPGYRCGGCPALAVHVVSVHLGPNLRYDYPACGRHWTEVVARVASTVSASRT
ncbi:hypothetical protein RVR_5782 [Actinacidiphila reveromycinica]|uniref:Uncharacterized protein n=1 Tax=Actinacidiphila reveromycinica TaxID=659352 RepID=A0A7U3UVA9_9ACTN|nr:hypothetical protein [Streptomyces sp. SN-593]BBA99243.1 hypothetical protein RVR_5782 [Streptomyces sp. SN-593]